jgi:hypothetical protein
VDNAHISREGPKEEIQSCYGIFQPTVREYWLKDRGRNLDLFLSCSTASREEKTYRRDAEVEQDMALSCQLLNLPAFGHYIEKPAEDS